MKNKILTAMLGTVAVMTVMTGCGQKQSETEPQTVEIAAVEAMTETGSETETQKDTQTEFMELDLSEIEDTSASALEISTGDLIEDETEKESANPSENSKNVDLNKPGTAETELQETETGKVKKPTSKKEAVKTEETQKDTSKKQTETKSKETETVTEKELLSVETDTVIKRQETLPKAETEITTEAQTESETETETEITTEAQTERETETETEITTEAQTESETESETETETEITTEAQTESETEIEQKQQKYITVSDRVNIRRSADTESDILELLIPGNLLEILEQGEEWTQIRYESEEETIEGYIKTDFAVDCAWIYEASEKVNVRKSASTDAEKLGQLNVGDCVVVMPEKTDAENTAEALKDAEWYKVHFSADGELVKGYVKAEFLKQIELSELLQSKTAAVPANESAEQETEDETSAETEESEAKERMLSYGLKGQLELIQLLFPSRTNAGIIYSAGDKGAEVQLKEYGNLIESYEMNLQTVEIIDEMDIDLAASELVGTVDYIICLDDETVNGVVSVICAYADEVEIPVIGISETQAADGCVAAYDGKTVIWNQAEAKEFGLSADSLNLLNEIIYK